MALDKYYRSLLGGQFAIYPFGDIGLMAKRILEDQFCIKPRMIFDDNICEYNATVKPSSLLKELSCEENKHIILILATANPNVHDILRNKALQNLFLIHDCWMCSMMI